MQLRRMKGILGGIRLLEVQPLGLPTQIGPTCVIYTSSSRYALADCVSFTRSRRSVPAVGQRDVRCATASWNSVFILLVYGRTDGVLSSTRFSCCNDTIHNRAQAPQRLHSRFI